MLKADQEHIGRELREIWCDAAAAGAVTIPDIEQQEAANNILRDIMVRSEVLHEYLLGYDLIEGLAEA